MQSQRDIRILRELAKRYAEVCQKETYAERRALWRKHNSLIKTRPLIYVRWLAAWHEAPESHLECEDPFFRRHEEFLRQMLFQDTLEDDYVLEPWITQPASYVLPPEGIWGVPFGRTPTTRPGGSWKYDPPLKRLEDIEKLVAPHHVIDEEATRRNVERLQEAVGDILTVNVERAPVYRVWNGDLSTCLAYRRGLEQVMWDMVDHPQWLHRLLAFLRDGVLTTHAEAERAGDWHLADHENQAMPYAEELPDPRPNSESVPRRRLWAFAAAQELTLVSPAMHDEFMLRYQIPILEQFGLVAYGCCEDLTHKIDLLRRLRNLRRIAVTPRADVWQCAAQIGRDYVISWRPNPAEMICCGFDPEHIRRVVRDAMEACKGLHVDITLKDVETVQHQPERLREWVRIVRAVSDDY
jgi:hypothetical protein